MNANQEICVHWSLSAVNYSLEKSHRFLVVRDEHVFVVAIMVEHHFVVFALFSGNLQCFFTQCAADAKFV